MIVATLQYIVQYFVHYACPCFVFSCNGRPLGAQDLNCVAKRLSRETGSNFV